MAVSVRLSDAIDDYIAERAPELSEHYVRSVRSILLTMLTSVGNIWVKNVTPEHMARHLNGEFDGKGKCVTEGRRQHLAPASFNVTLSTLKSFFDWCQHENMITRNPTVKIRRMAVPRTPKARLKVPDLTHALEVCDHPRDRAFIALAMNTGLRTGELTALRVGMLRLEDGLLDVRIFKSSKTDTMPVTASLDREMRRWLAFYEREARDLRLGSPATRRLPIVHDVNCDCGTSGPICPDWYLVPAKNPHCFVNGQVDPTLGRLRPRDRIGSPIGIANKVLEAMGVKVDGSGKGEGMHTFRRAAAQAVFEAAQSTAKGRDNALEITRSFLHHSQVSTTERYLDREKAKDARDELLKGVDLFAESTLVLDAEVIELDARRA